jgi:hypothetical protein
MSTCIGASSTQRLFVHGETSKSQLLVESKFFLKLIVFGQILVYFGNFGQILLHCQLLLACPNTK